MKKWSTRESVKLQALSELMLLRKCAYALQANMANNEMKPGDAIPAHLPNLGTLRNVKSSENRKKLADSDPIVAVRKMKDSTKYDKIILDIGMDPLYVSYATELQREWQRTEIARKRLIVSIDATGALIDTPNLSSLSNVTGKHKPIFLYIIHLHGEKRSLPVYQYLSQRHTLHFVSYMLNC